MSWSDVFPILSDEHVDEYEARVSTKERRQYEQWFAVQRVVNPQPAGHILSTSLFWKNIRLAQPRIVIKDRAMLMRSDKKGKLLRYDPWTHYVAPLLQGAHWLRKSRLDAVFRVYLAADLEFLLPDLVAAGCEVYLMKSDSLAHNPGAMWRLLAFEEVGKLVTVVDADRAARPESDLARTEEAKRMGLGWWRVPVWGELNEVGNFHYRPILGCQFGGNRTMPMKLLMQALIWHTERKSIETHCRPPGCQPAQVHGSVWPDYGFDEWFLQTAVYPRAVLDGVLSMIPADAKSRMLPLDIEFTMAANPASELQYFGSIGGDCCPPARQVLQAPAKDGGPAPLISAKALKELDSTHLTRTHPLPPEARRVDPGDHSIDGTVLGWMNPSLCHWAGKRWLAYRTECHPSFRWSRISLVQLTKEGEVIGGSNRLLSLPTQFGEWGAEDPRLFVHENRLFLSYTDGWAMGLAELDAKGRVLSAKMLPGPLPGGSKREKNWGCFSFNNQLYVDYWISPHQVYEFDPILGRRGQGWVTEWTGPGSTAELHGGSSPVLHGGLFWRLVHYHEAGPPMTYVVLMVAFAAAPPFEMKLVSRAPLLRGVADPQPYRGQPSHGVVFPSSLERTTSGWRITAGINDRKIMSAEISDAKLGRNMVQIE